MPTVLTFDEMYKLRTDQWIWVEVKGHPVGYTDGLYYLQLNRYVSKYRLDGVDECLTISTRELHGSILFDTSEEGWRIWSDKPTENEMNSVKWDYSTWPSMHTCVDCALYNSEECACDDGYSKTYLSSEEIESYDPCMNFTMIIKEH